MKITPLINKVNSEVLANLKEFEFGYITINVREDYLNVGDLFELEEEYFKRFVVIGSNDSGDPVCINSETQFMVYLNHDNYFKEELINTDLSKFIEMSRIHSEFYSSKNKMFEDSFYENDFTDESFKKMKIALLNVECLSSHWKSIIEYDLLEREEERQSRQKKSFWKRVFK